MTEDQRSVRQTPRSAGGVVYRVRSTGTEIVLCGRSQEGLWALPKGTPVVGESLRETALREVREETGLQVAIEEEIGSIRYEFARNGTSFDKTVEHHLMVQVGGDFDQHDGEFDEVRWVPVDEAILMMRYEDERDIVRRAIELIAARHAR